MTTPIQFAHARRRRRLNVTMPAVIAVVVALATYLAAWTSGEERVAQMWLAATVADDGSAEIVEVIDYDFGTNSRHGIFREVPDLRTSAPVEVSSPDAPDDVTVTESFLGFDPQIRIGDPNDTLTGQHRYVLRYTLDGVAQDGRVAWDAVGAEWDVPIEDVEVRLVAAATLERVDCSAGATASGDPCTASGDEPGLVVATVGHLDPGEGITVSAAVGEPLEVTPPLPDPTAVPEPPGVPALDLAALAVLVALLAGLAAKWLLRRADRHHTLRRGSPGLVPGEKSRVYPADLADFATPSSQLPHGLTPVQGGILLSGFVNSGDMAAWLAEQAAAGVLDLEPGEAGKDKTVVMVRRQPGDGFVREVLDGAFGKRERLTLGTYDSRFATAWKKVEEQLRSWRDTSGLWDMAARRRAKWAKLLGLVAGTGGLVPVIVGGTMATSAGTTALATVALGAALTAAGFCVALSFWGTSVLTPEGSAAWLQVESLRLFLTLPPSGLVDREDDGDEVPTDQLAEYTSWAVALRASLEWSRVASRIADTSRERAEVRATDTTFLDSYSWIRHATLADTLSASCHASSHLPSPSSSSGGSSSGSSSSIDAGGGSGGGDGGSW